MDRKRVQKLIEYWLESAENDVAVMDGLFKLGHFVWTLFLGHLILEKVLKAHIVRTSQEEAPKIHDLSKLAVRASLKLSKKENNLLSEINDFNLEARYPEIKYRAYKFATREITQKYLSEVKSLKEKLCQQLKQNK